MYIVVIEQGCRQADSLLPKKKPFGLKSGWGTLNAERSCERYWAQESIKYTTMDTRAGDTNRAPGFTSIHSSPAEPSTKRRGSLAAAPGTPLASVYAI